jgi:amino acid adenylation domain-containing protein
MITSVNLVVVHGLFERQAGLTPGRMAVRFGAEGLTYAELDARANQLAHYLLAAGVVAETPVALHAGRSLEAVVGLLGVLKAGAAYLALDRRQPAERHRTLLGDAGARLMLTQGDTSEVDGLAGILRLDQDWARIAVHPTTPPGIPVHPEQIAYLAYTSGSTGTPKAALIPHRAVVRLVIDADFLTVRPDDVFLQFAPLAFDASTLEVWAPLLSGATLAVAPDEDLGPREIVKVAREQGVTVLWLTAGLFHQVVDGPLDGLSGLRTLIAGGDVLAVPSVNRVLAELPGVRMVNGYGPTENTTFTCCHEVTEPVADTVPIGRAISGTTVHVLDADLHPVPAGEPGELFTGGLGVARGYLGRPELTAEMFVPDPFATEPGARLYRTGDRARQRADGVLEFLGRLDKQVKIRGFRVEPGEAETALTALPEVRDGAVVAQAAPAGTRLAAFVVPVHRGTTSGLMLRARLHEVLPEYAVPSSVVLLDELPLTPNGKVNRAMLEARLGRPRPRDLSTGYRPPGTPTEVMLATVWADLLEISPVGVDDEFFELGGHSLLATRVTAEIASVFGVTVRPSDFYESPTVAELAALVDKLMEGGS